jgi:hypothetical protein
MSKVKEKLNEQARNELMTVIRKNTQHSPCIDNFENLLLEIDDPVFVNTTVNSMHNFLSEIFELFQAIDRVPQKKFKSKMLTKDFIDPMRFFNSVKVLVEKSMKHRAIIELVEGKQSPITVHTDGKPFKVLIDIKAVRSWEAFSMNYNSPDPYYHKQLDNIKEEARKKMLLWNYIPAIVKAVLQTKRRSLDMDTNSKRFK